MAASYVKFYDPSRMGFAKSETHPCGLRSCATYSHVAIPLDARLVAPESALRDEASGKIAVNKVSLASIAFALVVVAASSYARQSSDGDALPALRARTLEKSRVVQLRGYSASGTHQCGPGRSCVVTASGFSNCNDASAVLQTRDCCPTTPTGGRSSGFVLNYCIPDRPL
jgi:hypothetical protein